MTSTDDKIRFKVYVSARVVERFKRMISIKHPAYKQGLISREVEEAMTRHVGIFNTQAQSTQTPVEKDNPIHQVYRLKEDIKQYLVKSGRYEEEPRFVPNKLLEEAICALRGLDNRTLRKWKKLLQQYGCLKSVGISQWEILQPNNNEAIVIDITTKKTVDSLLWIVYAIILMALLFSQFLLHSWGPFGYLFL